MSAGLIVTDADTGPFAKSMGQGAEVVAPSGAVTMDADGVFTLAAGAVTTAKIADDAVTAAKAPVFVSTEQTGTGSAQNVAHGLGVVPALVLVAPTELAADLAAGYDCAEGTHTSTNVVVTVTTGAKFKVLAWA